MAEHAKYGNRFRRLAITEPALGRLRFAGALVLVILCFFVPVSYGPAKLYLTGDPVTARVSRCYYPNPESGHRRGLWCDGVWTLHDGTLGSGRIQGIAQRTPIPVGTPVAIRATHDEAVTDSATWVVQLTLGVIGCIATVILIARLFRYLIRATRPPE